MHPEVQRPGPGSCPICGMALEPMTPTPNDGPSPEYADMKRRFWIGLVLSLPVVALEMGGHLIGLDRLIGPQIVELDPDGAGDAGGAVGGLAISSSAAGLAEKTRHLNMFTLIAMGTGVAWIYSMVATLAPGCSRPRFAHARRLGPVYFEAAAVITVLVLLGQCSNCAPAKRPAARSARCSTCRPSRPPSVPMVATRRSRSIRSGRRHAARAPRREGAGRWRGLEGAARSMNRWSPANPCRSPRNRRKADRRHDQPDRRPRDARREGRPRHHARADRPDGRRSPAQPRADPAARRYRLGLVRAGGDRGRGHRLHRLVAGRPGAAQWPMA
jgi:hypothetical protein